MYSTLVTQPTFTVPVVRSPISPSSTFNCQVCPSIQKPGAFWTPEMLDSANMTLSSGDKGVCHIRSWTKHSCKKYSPLTTLSRAARNRYIAKWMSLLLLPTLSQKGSVHHEPCYWPSSPGKSGPQVYNDSEQRQLYYRLFVNCIYLLFILIFLYITSMKLYATMCLENSSVEWYIQQKPPDVQHFETGFSLTVAASSFIINWYCHIENMPGKSQFDNIFSYAPMF